MNIVSGLGLVCHPSHEWYACFHSVLQHILLSCSLADTSWFSRVNTSSVSKMCAAHPAVRAHQIWNVCSHTLSAPVWKVSSLTQVPSCFPEWKCWNPKSALLRCIFVSVGWQFQYLCVWNNAWFFFKPKAQYFGIVVITPPVNMNPAQLFRV